jgi:hypothetical protein
MEGIEELDINLGMTGFIEMDMAGVDFDRRRRVIEDLNVQAALAAEDGQKVVCGCCILGSALVGCVRKHWRPSIGQKCCLGVK